MNNKVIKELFEEFQIIMKIQTKLQLLFHLAMQIST